jgi:hypothetical protein
MLITGAKVVGFTFTFHGDKPYRHYQVVYADKRQATFEVVCDSEIDLLLWHAYMNDETLTIEKNYG